MSVTRKAAKEFLDRVKRNDEAHAEGERINLRRIPALPREARTVASATGSNAPHTIVPIPYETFESSTAVANCPDKQHDLLGTTVLFLEACKNCRERRHSRIRCWFDTRTATRTQNSLNRRVINRDPRDTHVPVAVHARDD
ncbi:hypothetical protein B0H16DRAFT_229714 [Mycena metata]|uniref:Uncharacterized protein n=1 Tax=Mycena metata TaxID=1033252 RepID=A0AAD7MRF1_9AGAR|nr:hypothetical protein B0H16DRAFT_229714 [Mycena metata]